MRNLSSVEKALIGIGIWLIGIFAGPQIIGLILCFTGGFIFGYNLIDAVKEINKKINKE